MTPQEIYSLVAAEMVRVEEELHGYTRHDIEPIAGIGEHLLGSGGKRIRPALLLLAGKMLGEVSDSTIRLAAVVELIHNATLVHDDIIDGADTRRGRPSANTQWGNSMTVLAGDWLYMQSFSVALREKNLRVLAALIEITQKMVEGELLQLTLNGQAGATPEQILDIAERKTAWLFSGCLKLPAIASNAAEDVIERLDHAGRNLGMAFQLVDDLLDLTSNQQTLGKPAASDLKEGKLTLPLSYTMQTGKAEHAAAIRTVLGEREFRTVDSAQIQRIAEESGGLRRTRTLAMDYGKQARSLLQTFPASPYRDAITSIPDFILNRKA
jgi:octaprenyl-diphosphate synthase